MQVKATRIILTLIPMLMVAWTARYATGQQPSPVAGNVSEQAQTPESVEQPRTAPRLMPEVVVTATRTKEDVEDIAQSVTVVTTEEIERRQPRTPNQALREEPGIFSPETAAQGSPIIRGQIGNRVLYLWDGIPINNGALFGGPTGYFNQFPMGAVERIEVIRGPGAVQYGSGAIGGVINILSKRVDDFPAEARFGGDLTARYGTVDHEVSNWADLHFANQWVNAIGGFTFQNVDDTKGPGVGVMHNTGFEALGGYANVAGKPAKNQTVRFSWIYGDREDVETYVQSKLNLHGVPRIFNPYERRGLAKLDYQLDDLGALSSELKMYAYYQFYNQLRERAVETNPALTTTKTGTNQRVLGGGIQNTMPWNAMWWKPRLIYGADYRWEILDSDQTQYTAPLPFGNTVTSVPAGKIPNGTYDVFDLFAMIELHPLDRLTVSVGGRYERTHLHSSPVALDVLPNAGYTIDDLRLDKTWSSPTWSVGAVYGLLGELDLAASVATGFRAPTFSDTLSTGAPIFSSLVASVPSPNVGPEKSITYEAGPRYHSAQWNASLTAYWTQLTDVIRATASGTVVIPGQGVFTAQRSTNAGKGYVRGIEFAAAFKPHANWTFFGNATYTEGRDTNFDEYYRFIPPLFGTLGIRYEAPSKRWWVEVTELLVNQFRHHAPTDETDATLSKDPGFGSPSATNPPLYSDFTLPGYAVTNLRAGVKVWENVYKTSFELTSDLNNVLNKRYREAYSQQELVAPGINWIVSGRLKF
jgi:hemoglobin/transferrin/lactoferrin receptor protein